MDKRIELYGKTANGFPLIHQIEPGSGHGLGESFGLEKTASGEHLPQVIELIESIEPQPDRLYLVNSALGAGEYVGFNLRGDWFTEKGLLHEPEGWNSIPVWDIEARRAAAAQLTNVPKWGPLAWGYPTFYNAHRFRHHVNKDPNRAYGYILGAFWDPRMHRVILVSELVRSMCERLGALGVYERIERGEFPDTSMGAKVPFDVCSICGHVARTPASYCEHVRKDAVPPYGMKKVLPDGRKCGVYNHYPRFFDDSLVFIGAERSAKVMDNVTSRVRGNRSYGNKIYKPGEMRAKIASSDEIDLPDFRPTVTEREEQEIGLGRALERASKVHGARSNEVASRISSVLSRVPVANEEEKAARLSASERLRREAALDAGQMTDAELRIWKSEERKRNQGKGVSSEAVDRARALLHRQLEMAFGEKIGSHAKWAEHLKRIPVPTDAQKALIRDHAGRMTEVLPRHVLDAPVPGKLDQFCSGLANLGVVLRPREFQYCALRDAGDLRSAEKFWNEGKVFRPVPLDHSHRPHFRARPGPGWVDDLKFALGGMLERRSFAPRAVVIRISSRTPSPTLSPLTHHDDPGLNKIAQRYNDYRLGLLESDLNWSNVPVRPVSVDLNAKLAGAAGEISTHLLHLAYWPHLPIG